MYISPSPIGHWSSRIQTFSFEGLFRNSFCLALSNIGLKSLLVHEVNRDKKEENATTALLFMHKTS